MEIIQNVKNKDHPPTPHMCKSPSQRQHVIPPWEAHAQRKGCCSRLGGSQGKFEQNSTSRDRGFILLTRSEPFRHGGESWIDGR